MGVGILAASIVVCLPDHRFCADGTQVHTCLCVDIVGIYLAASIVVCLPDHSLSCIRVLL